MLWGVLYIMESYLSLCTRLKDFDLVDLVKIIHTKFIQNFQKSLVEVFELFEVAQSPLMKA